MRVGEEAKFEHYFTELRTLSKLERHKCEHHCKSKAFMTKTITFASFLKLCKFVTDIDVLFSVVLVIDYGPHYLV